ncbi:MAG TPA: STAS domain-containing protein [Actinomycetes bacterium]|jgi:anti-anti-sigma factor|nr:STAS domain-containing protein [Actinomycetes bacterium]
MAVRELEATVRDRDGVKVIDLAGDIERASNPALRSAYAEAAGRGRGAVVLNFERVGYINSTGIALIVGLLAQARAEGQRVVACGLSDHYREIFQITRLSDYMRIYPDEQSAVGSAPATAR